MMAWRVEALRRKRGAAIDKEMRAQYASFLLQTPHTSNKRSLLLSWLIVVFVSTAVMLLEKATATSRGDALFGFLLPRFRAGIRFSRRGRIQKEIKKPLTHYHLT